MRGLLLLTAAACGGVVCGNMLADEPAAPGIVLRRVMDLPPEPAAPAVVAQLVNAPVQREEHAVDEPANDEPLAEQFKGQERTAPSITLVRHESSPHCTSGTCDAPPRAATSGPRTAAGPVRRVLRWPLRGIGRLFCRR